MSVADVCLLFLRRKSICQPYSLGLLQSSICLPYLDGMFPQSNVNNSKPYLVSRSRLSVADRTERSIANLFSAWDLLFGRLCHPVQQQQQTANSSASHNCLEWAKRLTCARAYPRCQASVNPTTIISSLNVTYNEWPVCR